MQCRHTIHLRLPKFEIVLCDGHFGIFRVKMPLVTSGLKLPNHGELPFILSPTVNMALGSGDVDSVASRISCFAMR